MGIKEIDLAEEIFLTNLLNGVVLVKSLANKIFSINLSKFLKEEFEKNFINLKQGLIIQFSSIDSCSGQSTLRSALLSFIPKSSHCIVPSEFE